jgi:hypothetical protein
MPKPTPPIVVVQKKSGWGCAGTGCVIVLIIAVLAAGALYLGGKKALQTVQSATTTVPVVIPTADAGPEVYTAAENKMDTFEQAFQRGAPATLHLNTEEINTLIARDPDWEKARGRVAVQLKDNTARLQASIDLSMMGTQIVAGRFLNVDSDERAREHVGEPATAEPARRARRAGPRSESGYREQRAGDRDEVSLLPFISGRAR